MDFPFKAQIQFLNDADKLVLTNAWELMNSRDRNHFQLVFLHAAKGELKVADWREADFCEYDINHPLMVIIMKVHVHNGGLH